MSGRSQMTAMNGKRPSTLPMRHQSDASMQHFDLINYIYTSWTSVSRELDMCHNQSHGDFQNYQNGASVTYYQEREPNPQLKAIRSGGLVGPASSPKYYEECKFLVPGLVQ